MQSIVLATLNARYIHASLGLRYLYANMAELQPITQMREFTLDQRPEDIVETLLNADVHIIGFGVYIWNVTQTLSVMRLIKILRPDIVLVVGGPEVSYEVDEQEITELADHVVLGAADLSFAELCRDIRATDSSAYKQAHEPLNSSNQSPVTISVHTPNQRPAKIVTSLPMDIDKLASPYEHYSDEDIKQRVLYVEASRGCPFKCEFCLSSLDKTATAFDLEAFLAQMQQLVDRGARQFKFVDRTFNLKAETSRRILEFFLDSEVKNFFLHFELIPDRLPDVLLDLLPKFPENSLQFEIGIQSFNADVQKRISRKQQHERTCHNLQWLRKNTQAHIHADLIFGLPGEDINSFADGFNMLHALGPQEIQVGVLKRLRGTPIARHTEEFDMRYMDTPPYRILAHKDANYLVIQRMVRFARYWDLIGNSGRFPNTLPLLLSTDAFRRFDDLSQWLFETTAQTHRIALPKLFSYLFDHLSLRGDIALPELEQAMHDDFIKNKLKGRPNFLQPDKAQTSMASNTNRAVRQHRHVQAS